MTAGSPLNLSRRQILGSLSAVGAIGTAAGAGTNTFFSDTGGLDRSTVSGDLNLVVDWKIHAGPNTGKTGSSRGLAEVPIQIDEPNQSGSVVFTVRLPGSENNRGRIWAAPQCPTPAGTRLAHELSVTLSRANPMSGDPEGTPIAEGSLVSVANELRSGVPIEPGTDQQPQCLSPGDTAALILEWELGDYVGHEATTLPMEFVAKQCRHTEATANPFGAVSRPRCGTTPCPCCRHLGTLTLDRDLTDQSGIGDKAIDPGTYEFTEGGQGYQLQIDDTVDKPDGAETIAIDATLISDEGTVPGLCRVILKGGATHGGVPDVQRYERTEEDGLSPATRGLSSFENGLLYGPHVDGDEPGGDPDPTGAYHAISELDVFVCTTDESRCST